MYLLKFKTYTLIFSISGINQQQLSPVVLCSGEEQLIRHGGDPHHGASLCGAGVSEELDGYPRGGQGGLL